MSVPGNKSGGLALGERKTADHWLQPWEGRVHCHHADQQALPMTPAMTDISERSHLSPTRPIATGSETTHFAAHLRIDRDQPAHE